MGVARREGRVGRNVRGGDGEFVRLRKHGAIPRDGEGGGNDTKGERKGG